MKITHVRRTSVSTVSESQEDFDTLTKCQSLFFENIGEDTALLYFNGDDVNYISIPIGGNFSLEANHENEMLDDKIMIVFDSENVPELRIIKQVKVQA